MKNIDLAEARILINEFNYAMKPLCDKHDLKLTIGRAVYGGTNLKFKVELSLKRTADGDVEQLEWNRMCTFYGFTPNDYKRVVDIGNKKYRLVGFNNKARTRPIILEDDKGKRYKAKPSMILAGNKSVDLGGV